MCLPDEAPVDQSSPPWRVFDSPGPNQTVPALPGTSEGAARLAGANPVVALAGVAAALVVGGLAVVVALAGPGGATVVAPSSGLAAFGDGSCDAPADPGGLVVVDVAGAVVKPGVVRLQRGARVGDAIEAAGGFSARVDATRVGAELNLAAVLQDGAQVRVPSRDETPPPGGAGGVGTGVGGGSGSGAGGSLVNVNTASQSELEELPGIGPVTAEKIIASRATAPFTTIEDLRERGLVYESTFEDIRALITVG
jgi:competence protein ComEA